MAQLDKLPKTWFLSLAGGSFLSMSPQARENKADEAYILKLQKVNTTEPGWAPCSRFSMRDEREEGVCVGHGFIFCFQCVASKSRKVLIYILGVFYLLLAFVF